MLRAILIISVIAVASGCAIVDEPIEVTAGKRFEPIVKANDSHMVEHGVITVTQVAPRSDIVVLPPSVQHVVWRRDGEVVMAVAPTVERRPKPTNKEAVEPTRNPRENWPLLEEDMNFDTEIGRLDMCDRTTVCGPDDACAALEPCTNPEEYECFMTKPGEYCLERIK